MLNNFYVCSLSWLKFLVRWENQTGGGTQDGLQPVLQLAVDTSENRVAVVHLADNQYTNQGQQGVSRRSSAFTDATTSAGVTAENSRTTHPTGAGVKDGGSVSAVARLLKLAYDELLTTL